MSRLSTVVTGRVRAAGGDRHAAAETAWHLATCPRMRDGHQALLAIRFLDRVVYADALRERNRIRARRSSRATWSVLRTEQGRSRLARP